MYTLSGYGDMIADRIRIDAFTQALRGVIRPGAVVMDIGTGPGIMAVLACQLGASRVFAVEPSPIIQVAREIAAANGYANKIEFFEDISTKITPPVRADVIVSDMRGALPLLGDHIPSIIDARKRFLAPGGTLIGREDTIWAAVVEAPERFGKLVDPWEHNGLGQDLSPARRRIVNDIRSALFTRDQLLTKPQQWTKLDYMKVENPNVQGELEWKVERDGTGHGIAVWFDAELADGVCLTNVPGAPQTVYGSIFFTWLDPVPLAKGQTVRVDLQANLLDKDYFWRWTTNIGSMESAEKIPMHFDQSQLQGMVMSLAELRRGASDFIPRISEKGRIQKRALELMDGSASLGEIARRLASEFPERFMRWQQALTFAGEISKENTV